MGYDISQREFQDADAFQAQRWLPTQHDSSAQCSRTVGGWSDSTNQITRSTRGCETEVFPTSTEGFTSRKTMLCRADWLTQSVSRNSKQNDVYPMVIQRSYGKSPLFRGESGKSSLFPITILNNQMVNWVASKAGWEKSLQWLINIIQDRSRH